MDWCRMGQQTTKVRSSIVAGKYGQTLYQTIHGVVDMQPVKHTVQGRVKRFLWFAPKIVFDVIRHEQVWHDTSYGCGGGDWYTHKKTVMTLMSKEAALNAVEKLDN